MLEVRVWRVRRAVSSLVRMVVRSVIDGGGGVMAAWLLWRTRWGTREQLHVTLYREAA